MSDADSPEAPKTCATCSFFSALDTTCRYGPPKAFPLLAGGQMQVIGIFPPTQAANWCGAHSAGRTVPSWPTPIRFPIASKDS